MKIKPVFVATLVLVSGIAKAEIHVETACYSMVPPGKMSKPIIWHCAHTSTKI